MKLTPGNNMLIALMITTAIVGYDIQHDVKTEVKASEPTPVVAPTPSVTPVEPLVEQCETSTPFNKDIESTWGTESCNAKRILRFTYKSKVYGENTRFITKDADRVQRNGSVDRGLYRINSDTFNWYMKVRPKVLLNNGISAWDDMLNPTLNIRMGKIIFDYQGYCAWFAAPNDLCSRNWKELD